MREIRFRAWQRLFKEMIPVFSIDFENQMINTSGPWRFFNEVELMQFTGLKDKNGVEIYEGDILDYYGSQKDALRFEVVFHHASFKRKWINEKTAKIRGLEIETLAWNTSTIFEVIGNRYENPELLETKK